MSPVHLRDHILKSYPKSRLELLDPDKSQALLSQTPWLPPSYLEFLTKIGFGTIGDGRYSIYSGPIQPDFIFDEETAQNLDSVVLIGNDFAGTHEAYFWSGNVAVFGSVDSSKPTFEPHTHAGFFEFVHEWYSGQS